MVDRTRLNFLLENANALFGIIGNVNASFIDELAQVSISTGDLRVQLLACVYPASATQEGTLRELLRLVGQLAGRLIVSVLPIPSDSQTSPITTLAAVDDRNSHCRLWFENANLLEESSAVLGHIGMVVHVDEAALGSWLSRFAVLQNAAVPLTTFTASVPHLVPAKGSAEAAEAWKAYVESCRKLGREGAAFGSRNGNSMELLEDKQTAAEVERICQGAGIEPPDTLAHVIASILDKGHVVTIDKSSRTPPLELPVKAEWLGVESLRSVGLFSRETKYRLRIFAEKTNKDLNNRRNGVTTLLKRLSFPVSENLHWIPHAAKPLLEQERKRLEDEAQALIRGLIGKDTSKFAQERREAIERDANEFYREFHPRQSISAETLNKILLGLEERLGAALEGDFLPKVSFASIAFSSKGESAHVSNWGQARTFLVAIVSFFREALVDPYFFRGYRVPEDAIVNAMNVAGDWLVRHYSSPDTRTIARNQLALVRQIDSDEKIGDREKCQRLLALIKSSDRATKTSA